VAVQTVVGAFDIVATRQQAEGDLQSGALQPGSAGEGGALLDHSLHRLQSAPAHGGRLREHLLLQHVAVAAAGADDERQQARRPAELAAIEHELSRCRIADL
jgi:hypothetical protein